MSKPYLLQLTISGEADATNIFPTLFNLNKLII